MRSNTVDTNEPRYLFQRIDCPSRKLMCQLERSTKFSTEFRNDGQLIKGKMKPHFCDVQFVIKPHISIDSQYLSPFRGSQKTAVLCFHTCIIIIIHDDTCNGNSSRLANELGKTYFNYFYFSFTKSKWKCKSTRFMQNICISTGDSIIKIVTVDFNR